MQISNKINKNLFKRCYYLFQDFLSYKKTFLVICYIFFKIWLYLKLNQSLLNINRIVFLNFILIDKIRQMEKHCILKISNPLTSKLINEIKRFFDLQISLKICQRVMFNDSVCHEKNRKDNIKKDEWLKFVRKKYFDTISLPFYLQVRKNYPLNHWSFFILMWSIKHNEKQNIQFV